MDAPWGECEHRPPIPEGARPVFAGGKDRLAGGGSLVGPFFFGGRFECLGRLSNFDLSMCLMRANTVRPYGEEREINEIGAHKILPQTPVGETSGLPPSNFDLSVCYDRGTRFTIIGRRLYLRLPLLRGGSRVAGGEDEKN